MVKIVIENLGQKELTSPDETKTVLWQFHQHALDWMHACGGKGRCTTCRFVLIEGNHNLAPLTMAEQKYRDRGLLLPNERLSCQAIVKGEIKIRVPEECKLPHLSYTD